MQTMPYSCYVLSNCAARVVQMPCIACHLCYNALE